MTLVLTGLSNGFRVEADDTVDAWASTPSWSSPARQARSSAPRRSRRPKSRGRADSGVTTAVRRSYATTVREGDPKERQRLRCAARRPRHARRSEGNVPAGATRSRCRARRHKSRRPTRDRSRAHVVGVVDDSTALAGQPNVFLTVERRTANEFAGSRSSRRSASRARPTQMPDGLSDHRSGRRGRRHPPAAEGLRRDHVHRGAALDRRGADRRLGDLPVRARTHARLRGVQGCRRLDTIGAGRARAAGDHRRADGRAAGRSLSRWCSAPTFPMRRGRSDTAYLLLPVVAIAIGLLASIAGLRRAVTVDPALAFGGP